ncbi:hypothetical protein AB1Y20_002928 [Prymnesium parvum]|uniref:Uncharacterized protein n=1 Tax=Prymnesium parvum TaxID=97485 RepID=A0AB34J9D4_PRYPA
MDEAEAENDEVADDEDEGDTEGWTREDDSANDERKRWGNFLDAEPVWLFKKNIEVDESQDAAGFFFEVCKSWFDMDFLRQMADRMQECGRAKGQCWAAWRVTTEDLLQWIGVWYYFLAFPQPGDRRSYFAGPCSRRFGPRHLIEEWLRRANNGDNKGVKWFENMESVFTLLTPQPYHTP